MVVLLVNRFFAAGIWCGAAIEESVYYSADVKQLCNETEDGCSVSVLLENPAWRNRGRSTRWVWESDFHRAKSESDMACSDDDVAQRLL